MATHNCEKCPIRAKHDKAPRSLVGRFWRWYINFCLGWKKYYNSLNDEQKRELKEKYLLKK